MHISTLILIHTPLIIIIFCLFFYGKSLLDKNLIDEEKVIKEGISIPSFKFHISKSTIGFLLITLSVLLLIFTTNSILKNMQNNIDFIKKTFIVDNKLSDKNIRKLQKVQIQIQKSQIELSKYILQLKNKKKDGNGSK